ncbi:uncharacterized protein LOC135376731 isoform X2 [Ornithodoros turicata]|uniref:uncharacterized protein LOC135376731 isoform X2 n=1 Tax=Ornithodoros turicata TaxID=34597 RepID=UPI0031386E3C
MASAAFCIALIVAFIVVVVLFNQQSAKGSTRIGSIIPGNGGPGKGAPGKGSPGQKPTTTHASSTQSPKRQTTNAIPIPTTLSPPTAVPTPGPASTLSSPTPLKPTHSPETPSISPATTAATMPVITGVTTTTSSSTSTTTTTTSTSSSSTSTTSSPIGTPSTSASSPTERLLVCVTKDANQMPQNLCDVLLFIHRNRFVFKSWNTDVEAFASANAETCRGTKCGIEMPILVASKALQELQTTDGRGNLARLERNNLRHFAKLNIKLTSHENDEHINAVISFFKGLRDEQNQMQTRGLHIIGVIPAIYDTADTINDEMRSQLLRYARELAPDALLVRTSQTGDIVGLPSCRLNAPSLWTHLANVIGQPSFTQSLDLIKTVQLPSDLPLLLSFTCVRYQITYKGIPRGLSNQDMDTVSNQKCQKCVTATLDLWYNWDCTRNFGLEKRSMTNYVTKKLLSRTEIFMFDTNVTYRMKICNAQRMYNFRGGYVLFFVNDLDSGNTCKDTNFTRGYADIHYVRAYMNTAFTNC